MSHDVTKSGDASPLYARITCLHLRRYMFGSFADDLQVAHDGIESSLVIHEARKIHPLVKRSTFSAATSMSSRYNL